MVLIAAAGGMMESLVGRMVSLGLAALEAQDVRVVLVAQAAPVDQRRPLAARVMALLAARVMAPLAVLGQDFVELAVV